MTPSIGVDALKAWLKLRLMLTTIGEQDESLFRSKLSLKRKATRIADDFQANGFTRYNDRSNFYLYG